MQRTALILIALATALAGCGGPDQAAPSKQDSAAADLAPSYRPVVDIHHTMVWILEPPADVIWDSAGWIITAEGTTDLTPTTDEGWNAVIQAGASLAEAGNLLMIPGRSMGADWDEYASGLSSAAELAIQAGLNRDSDALFDAGGRIYQVCRACHNQYWVKDSDD